MTTKSYANIGLMIQPTDPNHLVPMSWVQNYVAGKVKMPARLASTINIAGTYSASAKALTAGAAGALVIDGVAPNVGDRVLLAGQLSGTQNGIYVVTDSGSAATNAVLTRAADFDESEEVFGGVRLSVNEGNINADTFWVLITDNPIVLDVTALSFIRAGASVAASKYAETITGDSSAKDFSITHALGSLDVTVSLRDAVSNEMVLADWTVADNNSVIISFEDAPSAAQAFRVVVIG